MRNKLTWAFALATAFAVSIAPGVSNAAEPLRPEGKMTREQLLDRDKKLFEDFQRQAEELNKQPNGVAQEYMRRRDLVQVRPHEVEMRIEQYIDGAILYSMPIDPKNEEAITRFGQFRRVDQKDQLTDRVVFEGRLYRVVRAQGSPSTWEQAIGRDAYVTLQVQGGMQQALSVRVKK